MPVVVAQCWPTGSRGTLVGSEEGPVLFSWPPLPAGGPLVERCLEEIVSKRSHRAVCPFTNQRGLQIE